MDVNGMKFFTSESVWDTSQQGGMQRKLACWLYGCGPSVNESVCKERMIYATWRGMSQNANTIQVDQWNPKHEHVMEMTLLFTLLQIVAPFHWTLNKYLINERKS